MGSEGREGEWIAALLFPCRLAPHASQAWRLWVVVFCRPRANFLVSISSSSPEPTASIAEHCPLSSVTSHLDIHRHTSNRLVFWQFRIELARAFCLHFGWHAAAARLAGTRFALAQASTVSTPPTTNRSLFPATSPRLAEHPSHPSAPHRRLINDKMTEVSSTRLYLGNLPRNGTLRHSRAQRQGCDAHRRRSLLTLMSVPSYQGRCRGSLRDPWHR
jgi:hypothetical protein